MVIGFLVSDQVISNELASSTKLTGGFPANEGNSIPHFF
jgi:hypothetical protein